MSDPKQQLLAAINALYANPDQQVKKQASAWLEQWQQSLEAWSISDAVLHDANCPMDAQYFCAQTLRTKVQKDFEELPAEAVASLRDSLMGLLLLFAGNNPIIRVQLCLALASMCAHLPDGQWGPGGIIQWLLNRLEGLPPQTALPVMLEMLIVLPQEAMNPPRSVHPERRRQLQSEMTNTAPMALQVLTSCLTQQDAQTRSRVLEAFSAWLQLVPGGGLPGSQLAQHPLVSAALEGLSAPETFDGAVEALVELIYSTSFRGSPDQDSMALVSRLVPAVMGLLPRFSASTKFAIAEQEAERRGEPTDGLPGADSADDEDTMKGMARLFAEVGEAFTTLIVSGGSSEAAQPVEALLEVASHPSYEICSMSFDFWRRVSRQLTSNFSEPSTSGAEESQRLRQQRREQFCPAFVRLVTLIQGRVRFPSNYDSMHEDEKQDFLRARYSIADSITDAADVLGEDRILQLLVEPLQSLGQGGTPFDWRTAEAALFCVKSVHRQKNPPNQPTLVALLQGLPQLPNVAKLQQRAANTLGAYAEWLAESIAQGGPLQEQVPQLLQMLITGMSNAESAGAAANALCSVCKACAPQLQHFTDALMQLFQQVQSSGGLAGPGSADTLALDEEDVQTVMEAVALVVSVQPEAPRRAALQAMLAQVVQPLQQALQQQQAAAAGGLTNGHLSNPADRVLLLFDRLTVVFRYVRDAGAVGDALLQVWPLLEAALAQNAGSLMAVERLCRAPRYGLRTAGKLAGATDLAGTIMAAVPQWFAATPHSSFLYLSSELVKVFGGVPRQEGPLAQLLGRLFERACSCLRQPRQFHECPELADDTFLLATRVLAYSPKLLLADVRLVEALLDTALAGIIVEHREAGESVLSFLSRLLERETLQRCSEAAVAQLHAALAARGPTLCRVLLAAVSGAVASSRIYRLSESLAALLKLGQESALQWFQAALGLLPDAVATAEDKSRLAAAAAEVSRAENGEAGIGLMDDSMQELSELARRNRRVREAAVAALLPQGHQASW